MDTPGAMNHDAIGAEWGGTRRYGGLGGVAMLLVVFAGCAAGEGGGPSAHDAATPDAGVDGAERHDGDLRGAEARRAPGNLASSGIAQECGVSHASIGNCWPSNA